MACEPISSQDGIIHFNPVIIFFMSLIRSEDSAKVVRSAKEKVSEFTNAMGILDSQSFFVFANKMLKWTPTENPLSLLPCWIVVFAQLIRLFMDTAVSISENTSQPFVDSPKAITTYSADCTHDNSIANQSIVHIQGTSVIEIKGLPWTIGSLLQGSQFADHFKRGSVDACVPQLPPPARPVSGRVVEAMNIQGAAYLEVDQQCKPIRELFLTAMDIENDRKCKPEAPDSPDQQHGHGLLGQGVVHVGQKLKSGDDISSFLFGGPDIICVFESRSGLEPENFVLSPKDNYSRVCNHTAEGSRAEFERELQRTPPIGRGHEVGSKRVALMVESDNRSEGSFGLHRALEVNLTTGDLGVSMVPDYDNTALFVPNSGISAERVFEASATCDKSPRVVMSVPETSSARRGPDGDERTERRKSEEADRPVRDGLFA
ncbi:uncharacterized protein LY79DRAFT_665618 [Colletotrichum navitas]|uniref:Uncharacterized protein n=1 Tax=Colletotrichum navitas TaxID=681940 RepID=A0AAD8QAQ0_9PEZI|nr:uncharacterized protein LY79DRAFT_665618 [Colletotrichum navitas]KAK1599077.1 hypothetical protein LY79DRAFT_665618 [Colletotrichum navitas]